eukprot:TRINITY_DN561_c0_g2_i1.p1 TRINITY_DN561_c0_g2~~TRINITY_DN561_c0_g2_i1.p1  ORF type:complete len:231 (-),score=22.99 TRINITY_DN561_c0_g2_i1:1394-2086(-)
MHIQKTSFLLISLALLNVACSEDCESELRRLGKQFDVDKFLGPPFHSYETLYCKVVPSFLHRRQIAAQEIRMLEIGFGCGHHVHGRSALLWSQFFGSRLRLYEIDYPVNNKCEGEFRALHPELTNISLFFGDQSNTAFLDEVLQSSGGKFHLILDDGGHTYTLTYTSFIHLWPHVVPGGFYVIEDLQVNKRMVEFLAKITDEIAFNKVTQFQDILSITCEREICVIQKKA